MFKRHEGKNNHQQYKNSPLISLSLLWQKYQFILALIVILAYFDAVWKKRCLILPPRYVEAVASNKNCAPPLFCYILLAVKASFVKLAKGMK